MATVFARTLNVTFVHSLPVLFLWRVSYSFDRLWDCAPWGGRITTTTQNTCLTILVPLNLTGPTCSKQRFSVFEFHDADHVQFMSAACK
jgi:hypothetical protein